MKDIINGLIERFRRQHVQARRYVAMMLVLALLTGCSGGGNGEDRLVAEAVADIFKGNSQNVEVSYLSLIHI